MRHLGGLQDGGEVPFEGLVHHPIHVHHRPLDVGWLPTQAAAVLLEGPRVGLLPHKFPADRRVVSTDGEKVTFHPARIRPGRHHFLEVALPLGRQGLAGGLRILWVTLQLLDAVIVPRG